MVWYNMCTCVVWVIHLRLMGNGTSAVRDVSRTCSDPIQRPVVTLTTVQGTSVTMFDRFNNIY